MILQKSLYVVTHCEKKDGVQESIHFKILIRDELRSRLARWMKKKERQRERKREQKWQTAWMNPKPMCQLDSNSPTQWATKLLHQWPWCQLENRACPAQIHHRLGHCQREWIHFNAGRYNMFFVFVKAGERRWTEKEKESKKKWRARLDGCSVNGLLLAEGRRERKREMVGMFLKNRKPSKSTWRTW